MAGCTLDLVTSRQRLGLVPRASVSLGTTRRYYSPSERDDIVKYFKNGAVPMPKVVRGEITIREMSRRCSISYDTLQRWMSEGYVLSPRPVGQRRYYEVSDVEVILRQIREIPPKSIRYLSAPPAGCYTIRSASRAIGATEVSLTLYIRRGQLPRPAHQVGRRMFYTSQDLPRLKDMMMAAGYKKTPSKGRNARKMKGDGWQVFSN